MYKALKIEHFNVIDIVTSTFQTIIESFLVPTSTLEYIVVQYSEVSQSLLVDHIYIYLYLQGLL